MSYDALVRTLPGPLSEVAAGVAARWPGVAMTDMEVSVHGLV